MIVETLHTIGLCLLVFYVIPSFDPLIGSILLLNVAFVPGMLKIFESNADRHVYDSLQFNKKEPSYKKALRTLIDITMVTLHAGVMGIWAYKAYAEMDDLTLTVMIPVSLTLTSLSWWDNYVHNPKKKGKKTKPAENGHTHAISREHVKGNTFKTA